MEEAQQGPAAQAEHSGGADRHHHGGGREGGAAQAGSLDLFFEAGMSVG